MFTLECAAFCFLAVFSIFSAYLNGSRCTLAVVIVGTVMCLAVNLNSFASTTGSIIILRGRIASFPEAAAAGIL